jgi:hypothetical protein
MTTSFPTHFCLSGCSLQRVSKPTPNLRLRNMVVAFYMSSLTRHDHAARHVLNVDSKPTEENPVFIIDVNKLLTVSLYGEVISD